MKILPILLLIALSVFSTGCISHVVSNNSPKFTIQIVDAVSEKPISGVKVRHRHYHWGPYTWGLIGQTDYVMGKTDSQGMIRVGKLNHYSRENWLDFSRGGFKKVNVRVRSYEQQFEVNAYYEHSSPDIIIPLSKSAVIEIPMRRK